MPSAVLFDLQTKCYQIWYLAFSMNTMSVAADNRPSPKKVAIVGPECTGKTSLAQALAKHFKTDWVPEYARSYLNKLNRPYEISDLTKIAHGQLRVEDEWANGAHDVIFCDTNLIVLKVWSEFRFGECDPEILKLMTERHYDLLLLTDIDVPWENDPQREHPDKRELFKEIYHKEVVNSNIPFIEISGSAEARLQIAITSIQSILKK